MDKNNKKWRIFCINMLLAGLISVVILVIVIFSLKLYTRHGREVKVPQITGLTIQEAEELLESLNLKIEVMDSTYSNDVPAGTVMEQNPPIGTTVKEKRVVFVMINARTKRMVTMPDVRDMSFRQAKNILLQVGFKVKDAVYVPSAYKDLVLDVSVGRKSVEAGEKVAEGSVVTLTVGEGGSAEKLEMPNVVGKNIVKARNELLDLHLSVNELEYDVEPTKDNKNSYYVYAQHPLPGTKLEEGSGVQLKLSLDKNKTASNDDADEEDEFF